MPKRSSPRELPSSSLSNSNLEISSGEWKDTTLKLFLQNHTPEKWKNFFDSVGSELCEISKKLEKVNGEIYPPIFQVFRAFYLLPPEKVKVVIIGQDCYHNKNQANGLAFAVSTGVTPPPSLRRICEKVRQEGYAVKSTDISKWVKRGVLLINSALTVEHKNPGSHLKLWEPFTQKLMQYLYELNPVFILWGNFAKNLAKDAKHQVVGIHPSPLAGMGFFLQDYFRTTNQILGENFDWSL